MTTSTDICNRALSVVGARSTIASLTEQSPEAIQCALWYDKLRQSLLRTAPWGFARRMNALSLIGTLVDSTAPYPMLFKYAYPSDCLKLRYTIPPLQFDNTGNGVSVNVGLAGPVGYAPCRTNRFLLNNDVATVNSQPVVTRTILSNVEAAIGVYTMDLTNPDMFDVLYEDALTMALAYYLVIPLAGNVAMRNDFRATAQDSIIQARVVDGNEAIPTSDHTPDWMSARIVSPMIGAGFAGWGTWYSGYDNINWGM